MTYSMGELEELSQMIYSKVESGVEVSAAIPIILHSFEAAGAGKIVDLLIERTELKDERARFRVLARSATHLIDLDIEVDDDYTISDKRSEYVYAARSRPLTEVVGLSSGGAMGSARSDIRHRQPDFANGIIEWEPKFVLDLRDGTSVRLPDVRKSTYRPTGEENLVDRFLRQVVESGA